jgi:FAD synthase
VRVQFEHHIRGDRRFDSVEELAAQLSRDCDEARRLLDR